MTSTAVRVGLRVRPLTQKEQLSNCTECLSYVPNEPQILIGTDKSYTYDYVFDDKKDQEDLYRAAATPLLEKFIDGFNATILAYGQTGSGKTYSMGTSLHNGNSGTRPEDEGIVPRCIRQLFDTLQRQASEDEQFKYEVCVSFLELYNEELVDLLNPYTAQKKKGVAIGAAPAVEVTIREDITGGIYWSGVREEPCASPEELLGFLAKGSLCRTTGSTDMNTVSSRSHAIFSVILKQQKSDPDTEGAMKSITSKFHFVDLAGSERLKRTNAQGDRAKEGIAINSGLLALGNVISALGDETRRATHVPYRDSKLTRLLQDSLGGNSQTLMLACVSPADSNFMETLNTLKYANRARNIKNRVTINQDFAGNSIEVSQLRAQVARLRMEIASMRADGSAGGDSPFAREENRALKAEVARLRDRIQDMSTSMIQVTSERDTLLMERELGEFMNDGSGHSGEDRMTTHPIISQYQRTIQDLNNELQDTRDRLQFLESTQPSAMHAMMMASSSMQRSHASVSFKGVSEKSTSFSTRRKRNTRRVRMTPTSSVTSRSMHTTRSKRTTRRPVISQSTSLKTQLTDVEDETVREEVKSSIAKAREEIQRGMQVLDLIKPLDDTAKDWEEQLKMFEEQEKDLYKEDMQRTLSDEGNFTPARSPVENDDLMSSDMLEEIETLAVPSWDDPATVQRVAESIDSDGSGSARAETPSQGQQEKYNPQMVRMLHQIQSDIRVKEELVSHLEKSETEYAFMRRKFDEKILRLQRQLVELQHEQDTAVSRTKARMSSKSEMTTQVRDKQQLIEIRQAYESKMKGLLSEIQELKSKYSRTTMTMQATRNQNETLLRSLRVNVETLKVEKKRMIKRMKVEAERVREQMTVKERKIQQLQRANAEAKIARRRLEKEHQQQSIMLKRRDEEVLVNNNQLKQMISVLKKAVREGGVLDERLLGKVSHIVGGSFALIARKGAGRRPMRRRRPNPIPVQVRAERKKELLDKALYQYIQGKQAVVEMEQLLFRREKLAAEKLELMEERRHIYLAEKESADATGQPMDTMALEFTDERIELISAEISYLSARVRALQSEAAGEIVAEDAPLEQAQLQQQRVEKRVTFADDIVHEAQHQDGWADMDALEEQFSVPPTAAPEAAYDVTLRLLKTLEYDECKSIAEALVDDIMNLRMSECNRQVTMQNLEKTVMDLRRTLVVMKRAAITTTVENERRIRRLEEKSHKNTDEDSAIDVKIEEYINSGNTIFDKIYEDGLRGVINTPEPGVDYSDSRRSSIVSFVGSGSAGSNEEPVLPPPSPLASPTYTNHARPPTMPGSGLKPPVSLTDKARHTTREATPSPDRFLNMIQRRLSWQQRVPGSESPIPFTVVNPADFSRYTNDRESSTSSIRSSHFRRSSVQSETSSQQSQASLRKRAYSLQQPLPNQSSSRRRASLRELMMHHYQQQQQQQPQQMSNAEYEPTMSMSHQQQRQPAPKRPSLGPIPSASTLMERTPSAGNVFDRLSQTPTRASRAKMAQQRYSSGSMDELRQLWELERASSALSAYQS